MDDESEGSVNWELLARSNTHPLRVAILEVLDGGRALSPKVLSVELRAPLGTVNYHVTQLAKSGLVELVRERQVRGATEHFYRVAGCEKRTTGLEPASSPRIRTP
jgi:DNA-binding transcriptional ArsR family regulator